MTSPSSDARQFYRVLHERRDRFERLVYHEYFVTSDLCDVLQTLKARISSPLQYVGIDRITEDKYRQSLSMPSNWQQTSRR
jgi:hypothetical protein